jgi:hypothetical protein
MIRLLAKLLGNQGCLSASRKKFSFFFRVQTGTGGHPASYPMDTVDISQQVKQPGRDADHSTLSESEV